MDARSSSRNRRISRQQEKQAAADLGGRTQAASGGTRLGGGGDVRVLGHTRVECKVTEKKMYSLKHAELEKVRQQAMKTLEQPVLQFAFRDKFGRMEKYAVVPGFVGEDKDPTYTLTTDAKSVTWNMNFLRATLAVKRLRLVFRLTKGPLVKSGETMLQPWEIMTWGTFMLRYKGEETE